MSLENSLNNLKNFCDSLEKELKDAREEIETDGKISIDPNRPVFIKTFDSMGLGIDLMDLTLKGDEANLRESILATRQILSEIDEESNKVI
jgi:hypothetical protein